MRHNMKYSRFWRLSLGLLLLGIGQRLSYTGVVSPWAMDRGLPILLLVLSLVALVLGLVFILPLMVWFYKRHRSDKRLLKLIVIYLLGAVLSGLIIGGLGQLLYDHTSLAYQILRTGVWVISTLIQTILKIILCFGLVSIHKQLPIRSRLARLRMPVAVVVGITLSVLLVSYWLPAIGTTIVSLVDATILIVTLYYFIYLMKGSTNEKTS